MDMVGGLNPSEKLVSWDDEIPNIWENKKSSTPPNSSNNSNLYSLFPQSNHNLLLSCTHYILIIVINHPFLMVGIPPIYSYEWGMVYHCYTHMSLFTHEIHDDFP